MKCTLICLGLLFATLFSLYTVSAASPDSPWILISLLNQDPNPARTGDTANLHFQIVNMGGQSVQNLTVELLEEYPFSVVNGDSVKSNIALNAYQVDNNYYDLGYTVKIDKDVVQSQKQIRLRYMYDGGEWSTSSYTIHIASTQYAQVMIDKSKLDPGKETQLKFTVTNTGSSPLQNMIFSWQEPTGAILPVYSSNTQYVRYLDVGQSVDLTYTVVADVNANPGLYQLNMNLTSESINNATPSQTVTRAGIFIGGETDFEIAFSESSQGQTSLSVANTGNNPAQSVSVKIPSQESFRVSGSNSAIIGNLDKGDYTIVSFAITSASSMNFSSQGRQLSAQQNQQLRQRTDNISQNMRTGNISNNLLVVIDYTDTTGARRSIEKLVPVQFRASAAIVTTNNNGRTASSSRSFIGSIGFWILILVIIIICAGTTFYLKNKRKKNTHKLIIRKK